MRDEFEYIHMASTARLAELLEEMGSVVPDENGEPQKRFTFKEQQVIVNEAARRLRNTQQILYSKEKILNTKTIIAIVEKSQDMYSVYAEGYGFHGFGDTDKEAIQDFLDAYNEFRKKGWCDEELDFVFVIPKTETI